MKHLSASSKSVRGVVVVGCAESEEEDASVDVVICVSTVVDSVWDVECCGVVVVDEYGCISESVSTFGIALAVVVVKPCISRSVVRRLGRRSPWARASILQHRWQIQT